MKGLGDVVVGPGLQALDLVLPVVMRGEDQDGESLAGGAQAADHLQARQFRQAEIDDRDVEGILPPREEPLFAVLRHIDREPGLREARFQRLAQRNLVFDHQYPHWKTPPNPSVSAERSENKI